MRSRHRNPPRPVACSRPSEPPRAMGLPVRMAGVSPNIRLYSSYIHPISRAPVFTSGAGMSVYGPMTGAISRMNERESRSSSPSDSFLGSTATPPLPPPNGMSRSAHFQVMRAEKHLISSWATVWWYRRPPLYGPRALLCWIRYPSNVVSAPSSIGTRTCTVVDRRWVSSRARIEASSPNRSAADSKNPRTASYAPTPPPIVGSRRIVARSLGGWDRPAVRRLGGRDLRRRRARGGHRRGHPDPRGQARRCLRGRPSGGPLGGRPPRPGGPDEPRRRARGRPHRRMRVAGRRPVDERCPQCMARRRAAGGRSLHHGRPAVRLVATRHPLRRARADGRGLRPRRGVGRGAHDARPARLVHGGRQPDPAFAVASIRGQGPSPGRLRRADRFQMANLAGGAGRLRL